MQYFKNEFRPTEFISHFDISVFVLVQPPGLAILTPPGANPQYVQIVGWLDTNPEDFLRQIFVDLTQIPKIFSDQPDELEQPSVSYFYFSLLAGPPSSLVPN